MPFNSAVAYFSRSYRRNLSLAVVRLREKLLEAVLGACSRQLRYLPSIHCLSQIAHVTSVVSCCHDRPDADDLNERFSPRLPHAKFVWTCRRSADSRACVRHTWRVKQWRSRLAGATKNCVIEPVERLGGRKYRIPTTAQRDATYFENRWLSVRSLSIVENLKLTLLRQLYFHGTKFSGQLRAN